jgi:Heavy metal binding domain
MTSPSVATPEREEPPMSGKPAGPAPMESAAPNAKPESATVYTCPMHPEVRQPNPGKCPKCGMELVPATKGEAHEHGAHP